MLCVRGEWRQGRNVILTQSSSDHSSTSSSSWLGLLNRGSLRAQRSLSAVGSHAGILSPTDSNSNWILPKPSVAPGYIIVLRPPASAVPPLIYTGASFNSRLGRGSIYIYIYIYIWMNNGVYIYTYIIFFSFSWSNERKVNIIKWIGTWKWIWSL